MKLYNVKDVKGLFETVNDCEGSVEMVLPSQNIDLNNNEIFAEVLCEIAQDEGIREIEIKAENQKDVYKLLHFAMRGKEAKAVKAEVKHSTRKSA